MKKALAALMLGSIMAVGVSCGPKPKPQTEVSFPWDDFCNKYANMEGGLAVCKCSSARSYEEIEFARDEATADARSELARILEVKVGTMIKRYKNRTVAGEKRYYGGTFEEVAKQVAKQYLSGSRVIATKTFRAPNGFMVCSVVALQPNVVKSMIHAIAQKTNLSNPRDEELLYEEFKSYKAQQELNKELQNYNK